MKILRFVKLSPAFIFVPRKKEREKKENKKENNEGYFYFQRFNYFQTQVLRPRYERNEILPSHISLKDIKNTLCRANEIAIMHAPVTYKHGQVDSSGRFSF